MSVTSLSDETRDDPAGVVLSAGLDVRHVRELPERPASYGRWPTWLGPDSPVRAAVEGLGIASLWEHQSRAAAALGAGRHVVLTTGTASGKSLAYLLPIATAALDPGALDSDGTGAGGTGVESVRWRRRPATSLYLAPTKALAHDQARVCAELGLSSWRVATVDGDTDPADRQWARDHAHHVLTNPDLVHASLLPNHQRWASFLRSLRYVVVDESHRYRGVFGAQVSAVLRRLRRVAGRYGADPTFALLSATAPDPISTASGLTGIDPDQLVLVNEDHSPRGPVRIVLAAPTAAPQTAVASELADRVRRGEQTLAFVPSRRLAEEVARSAAGTSTGRILAYRAGYLATDRRLIERGLSDGTVRGVAATNALELGVDIAGLDAVLMCGYPGSRAAFWQQAGRAGRRGGSAEVVLVTRPQPLDAYLIDHPEVLFDQPVETPVLDPASAPVLGPQLAAAAQELPLRPGDEHWFGATTWPIVSRLTDRGILRRRPDGWYWTAPQRAVDRINLRSTDSRALEIVEEGTGRVLGTVGLASADLVVHPGAVYVHQGETFLCDEVDAAALEAYVHPARPGYLTQALVDVALRPAPSERRQVCGSAELAVGPAQVSRTVTGYLRRDELTGQVWDSTPLDCPERVLTTTAALLTVPAVVVDGVLPDMSRNRRDAAVHALEHLLTGLLPAVVANDRWDVGTHSWLDQDGAGVIAAYDQQPGSGFAARAYERSELWLSAAWDRLSACACEAGCPSCILSTGCTANRPLDKASARRLLTAILGDGTPSAGSGSQTSGEPVDTSEETGRR